MQPVPALIVTIIVCALALYVFLGIILPFLWKYVLRPLSKIAYFLLLLGIGISFFMVFFLGKQLGIPEDVQIMIAIFSGVVSGVKWAVKRT